LKITPELIFFGALAGAAALCSIGVVASKNAVRSALFLVVNFFLLAFIYFTLNAEMLAITQVVVYTGAIMVLFLFVIMLLNIGAPQVLEEKPDPKKPIAIGLGVVLAGVISAQIIPIFAKVMAPKQMIPFGQPDYVGKSLFTNYVFPFESVSILLLIGIVGSILLAKRRIS
jgi:NADH-quinone oxidoreductase subunit J